MHEPASSANTSEPTYTCDVCGTAIEDRANAFILCSLETPPEAPGIHLVRTCCLAAFEEQAGPVWMLFSLSSPSASWLLPYPACSAPPPDPRASG
jgi:hypothetical protein